MFVAPVRAEKFSYIEKKGAELAGSYSLSNSNVGYNAGIRWIQFFGLHFNLGFTAKYGSASDGNLLYGGGLIGYEIKNPALPKVPFEFSTMIGYATTMGGTTQLAGVAIEPSVSFGYIVENGWRVGLAAGYRFVLGADLGAPMISVRLENKTLNTMKSIDY